MTEFDIAVFATVGAIFPAVADVLTDARKSKGLTSGISPLGYAATLGHRHDRERAAAGDCSRICRTM
jgi:hypothetical protein